jgi:hypothetical protein
LDSPPCSASELHADRLAEKLHVRRSSLECSFNLALKSSTKTVFDLKILHGYEALALDVFNTLVVFVESARRSLQYFAT